MLYINPEFASSGITYSIRARQVTTPALREKMSETIRAVSIERADFIGCLPLGYSGLTLRRRLVSGMLTLQKYDEASAGLDSHGEHAFSPAADYARSVIDMAMLRRELRCWPSSVMTCPFLTQTEELRSIITGVQQDMAQLRKEVRRKTDDFLWQFAAGSKHECTAYQHCSVAYLLPVTPSSHLTPRSADV
jgi:hypothetical protein